MEDFTEVEDHLWGMVKVDEDSFYEVNMNNMPESSVGLFCQGAPVTLSGIVDGSQLLINWSSRCVTGFAMSVDRWCDVSIEGHELFGVGEAEKDDQQLRASDALELRQTTELTLRSIRDT